MLKLTAKNSYINEILHEINDFKVQRTFVDCKLVCQGGVVQCHAAMLQYANIWWVNCRNSDIDECVIISYLSARQCLLNLETLGNVGRVPDNGPVTSSRFALSERASQAAELN